jgi:hypothetical protein
MNDTNFRPLMLIDVSSSGPKLYIPKEEENIQWCCLSYCWGGDQLIKTTKATREPFKDRIPWALLPKCVQDAVKTARVLGIPYLWVDCFCITQDDAEEMTSQISLMSEIYKRARVTIVASSAANSNEGFLQKRVLQESDYLLFALPFRCPDGQIGSISFFSDNGYDPRLEPVRKRAWTLQERLLSSRILDYGTRQMRWACQKQTLGDGGYRNPIPSGAVAAEFLNPLYFGNQKTIASSTSKLVIWEKRNRIWSWNWLVEDYTCRQLSQAGDKLPAISGVAREYSETFGATYLAGLFVETLPESLLWLVNKGTQKMRPTLFRAPSFSWAATDSPVSWRFGNFTAVTSIRGEALYHVEKAGRAEIVEARSQPIQLSAPYGAISDCYLKLKVRIHQAIWQGVPDFAGDADITILNSRGSGVDDTKNARVDAIDETYLQLCQSLAVPVYILAVVGHEHCLVALSNDKEIFRRVGCMTLKLDSSTWEERVIILR